MTATIGHNGGPTFDDIVRANIDRGILLTIKETIVQAVNDPRLERRHLRVLAEVIDCMNSSTGTAYPGRKVISDRSKRHDSLLPNSYGYSEAGIGKTISELISFGYLVSAKRAGQEGGRALAHYTIRRPSIEDLQAEITSWVTTQRLSGRRGAGSRPFPDVTPASNVRTASNTAETQPDATPRGNVTSDVTPARNVTHMGNVIYPDRTPGGNDKPADATPTRNVTPASNVTSDVTPVGATVTNAKELLGERGETREPERATARDGEEPMGHGIFVNGETIRHASFAISLPAIRMQTIRAGLTAEEVKTFCLGHALQWAAEIENGARPEKVIPGKIANFLEKTIMATANYGEVHSVRKEKAASGYGGRQSAKPAGGESLASRIKNVSLPSKDQR